MSVGGQRREHGTLYYRRRRYERIIVSGVHLPLRSSLPWGERRSCKACIASSAVSLLGIMDCISDKGCHASASILYITPHQRRKTFGVGVRALSFMFAFSAPCTAHLLAGTAPLQKRKQFAIHANRSYMSLPRPNFDCFSRLSPTGTLICVYTVRSN